MDEINPNDYFDSDDNFDMCELEARLYASVHHEAVDNNIPFEVPQYVPAAVRMVSNTRLVNNPKTNIGRYWSNNMNQNRNMIALHEPRPLNINQPQYVPYTSSFAEIKDNTVDNSNNTSRTNNNQPQKKVEEVIQDKSLQTTNNLNIPINQKKQEKSKPKRKQTERQSGPLSKQLQNINQILNGNVVKQSKIDKYALKKEKATKSRAAQKNKLEVINLIDNEDEDDDVIVIPTNPPPTVCLDSSDESVISKNEFAAPNKVKGSAQHSRQNKRIPSANNSRCPSPSSSIVSDDFIIQNDRSRILEGTDLNIAQDEDLQCVQPTVESVINPKKTSTIVGNKTIENSNSTVETPSKTPTAPKDTSSSLSVSSIENFNKSADSVEIFATPKHKSKKKVNKNYQVKENSFAAVDVYESESSDMPESIYDRVKDKNSNNTIYHVVSSDDDENDESVNDITVKKTKKLTKRKISGSGKSSEYSSDSSDYELSQPSPTEIASSSTPYSYIMRGDAVTVAPNTSENNDANKRTKPVKKRCKFDSEHHSDDEFITLLSSIIHDASDSDDDDDSDDSNNMLPVSFNNKKSIDKSKNVPKSVENININENISTNLTNEKPQSNDTAGSINEVATNWNREMLEFYNNSWGGEDFNTKSLLNKMNASSVNWHINNTDRFPRKTKAIRCLNCREVGHIRSRCPVYKKTICYMCGKTGHREPRCPNKLCLKCGAHNKVFSKECRNCFHMKRTICRLCKLRGHTIDICPDKWRRYHSTIIPQTKLTIKNNNNRVKYCCICAGKGHSDDKCVNALKTIDYSLSSYNIASYSDLYNYSTIKPDKQKFNLISEIPKNTDIKFNFDKNLNKNNFYRRFLKYIAMKNMNKNELSVGKVNASSRKHKTLNKQDVIISLNDSLHMKRSCQEIDKDNNLNENTVINVTIKDNQRIVTKENTVNKTIVDEDSNYSFNEFYSSQDDDANNAVESNQRLTVAQVTDVIRPDENISDYVSLTVPSTSDLINTIQIDKSLINNNKLVNIVDDDKNVQEDAKIFLSKEKIKELLTNDGRIFIQNSRQKYNINIILKWHSYSNFLIIIGSKNEQNQFYNDLKIFFNTKLSETRKLNVLSTLPKNKQMLIKFLRMNLNKLNNDNLGDIEYLYEQTCLNLNRSSDKSRNLLNMILIGQKGLRNGHQYIKELYNNIKSLENNSEINVSVELRKKICTNYQHIFCPIDDIDYKLLIKEYQEMEMKSKNVIKSIKSNQEQSPVVNEESNEILLNINYDKNDEPPVVIPESTAIDTITQSSAITTNNIDNIPVDTQDPNKPSKYWSDKCLVIVIKCLALMMDKGQNKLDMFHKLHLIKSKAYKHNLSSNDYAVIVKIFEIINKKFC